MMKTSKWDMVEIAQDLGVSRKRLYKYLAPGSNSAFGTVLKTLDNLGLWLRVEPKSA